LSRLAWVLLALAVLLVIPGPVLQFVLDYQDPADIPFAIGFVAALVCPAGAGAVIAARRPRHAVAWIFLAMGAGLGITLACGAYAELGIATDRGPLPGDELAAWLAAWLFIPVAFGLPLFLLLLFPTGRFLSPRWRRAGWLLGATVMVAAAATAFNPGRLEGQLEVRNPLGAPDAIGGAVETLEVVTTFLALPCFALAVTGLVVRFRRARGVERQQLKWFTFAAALVAVGFAGSIVVPGEWPADALFLIGLFALAGLPIAAGIAILRHRLYDIDVVIRRTLIYGALTATLAAGYLACVLVSQLVIGAESNVAIAASTLTMAALFRPALGRIQAAVDRRFYRRRYDAARTLEAFGVRLRHELDLDALGADLRGVARETLQPAHVSLWLRSPR